MNLTKHGIDFPSAERFIWEDSTRSEDTRFNYGEVRDIAYGPIGRRIHVLVYTRRGEDIHVISLRKANGREIAKYAEAKSVPEAPATWSISEEEDAAITAAAADDPDNPIWDDETLSRMRPVIDVAPELIEMAKRRGRPPLAAPKVAIKIRLSADVLSGFRATGAGWQTRIDEALRKALEFSELVRPK